MNNRLFAMCSTLALALIALCVPAARAQAVDDDLQQRLTRLCDELESQRIDQHIPGMAIAIVRDDEIILARGFGEMNHETGEPATAETRFMVGSTTKAFTATLIAMLADEGVMHFDDAAHKHLDNFSLSDETANENLMIRDLLCHRTGLASMSLLWYASDLTSDEILDTASGAEMLHHFREVWNYNNICFLAAGTASANAAGTNWHDLLQDRLLSPLNMVTASSKLADAKADPQMAAGYQWFEDDQTLMRVDYRSVDPIAPAGSINASALDMAQWVRFNLGKGVYKGERLVSEAMIDEMWSPHITIAGNMHYGLGWMVRDWQGNRCIEHSGGIDGFTAEVAMLPDENLGFVLLMNRFAAPLQESSRDIVFDSLLNDPPSEDDEPVEDFTRFVGNYIAEFPPFNGSAMEVSVQDGALAVDVPGQMVFELKAPDEQGIRRFVITDMVGVRFNTDEQGDVYSMEMHQNGQILELPREGSSYPLEIDLEAVQPHLGTYHFADLGADCEVKLVRNRLAIDVPGQMAFELYPPDEQGRWVFRFSDQMWLEFQQDENGETTSIAFTQSGQQATLERVENPDAASMPTIEELVADRPADLEELGVVRSTGHVDMPHINVSGTVNSVFDASGNRRDQLDLGRFGHITTILDGENGWIDAPFINRQQVGGIALEQARLDHLLIWAGRWSDHFKACRVERTDEIEGTPVVIITATPHQGPPMEVVIERESGRVVGRNVAVQSPVGMTVPTHTRYMDWRPVAGIELPHRIESRNELSGAVIITIDAYETDVKVPDDTFIWQGNGG